MSTPLEKIDPSMFNVLPIKWGEDPVNSLSTINLNFSALDVSVCNLEYSANNFWNPLYNDFNSGSAKWESIYDTVNQNSGCWESTNHTVRTLSGGWTSPLTIVYPYPLASINISTLTTFINVNFPIRTGSCLNYFVGQELLIFVMRWKQAVQKLDGSCTRIETPTPIPCISKPIPWAPKVRDHCRAGIRCTPSADLELIDRYVSHNNGYKYIVNSSEQWEFSSSLY